MSGEDMKENFPREIHHRRSKRSIVLLHAVLRTSGGIIEVRLRNLSTDGALLEARDPPAAGTEVTFERGQTIVSAIVARTSGTRFAVQFLRPIEESEVLIHVGKPAPKPDAPAPTYRRAGFHGVTLSATERRLGAEWAALPGRKLDD
jgi:hypothetical protein